MVFGIKTLLKFILVFYMIKTQCVQIHNNWNSFTNLTNYNFKYLMCFIIVATSAAPAVLNGAYCPNAVVVTLVTVVTFINAAAVQLSFHM